MARIYEWMTIHKWMTDYTPQTEWIERRGLMVWIAEVFTSLGSGLYLISLFFSMNPDANIKWLSWWGLLLGWIIIMFLKIPIHLAYFGKPWRFWRTIPPFSNGWKTSWFARGIIFSMLFGGFAFLQLVSSFLILQNIVTWDFLPALDILFKVLGGITALLTGIYPGFIMNYVKGVQFWNSALLPVILVIGGVLYGCALLVAVALFGGNNTLVNVAEELSRILLIVNIFLIAVYLWSATYMGTAAKVSVMQLIRGKIVISATFWIGVVILGMLIPLAISLFGASSILLIVAIITHIIGAFALKYCILKVGIYKPLFAVNVCA
jgi:formate-dependent nitrite reductase membrane component NrfD